MSLLPNTTYYVRVKALNFDSESDYSDTISVTTLNDPDALIQALPPSKVNILKIITDTHSANVVFILPDYKEYINQFKTIVSINSDLSSPLYTDLIYIYNKNTNIYIENDTKYGILTLGGLLPSTNYFGSITASNKNSTSVENSFNFTTLSVLNAPKTIGVTNLTQITAIVHWTYVNSATSYLLDVSTTSDFNSNSLIIDSLDVGNVVDFQVNALVENTKYWYRLKAKNSSMLSTYSNITSFKTLDALSTISELTYILNTPIIIKIANIFKDQFTLYWSTVENATNYIIDISTNPSFSTFIIENINVKINNYTVSNLNSNTLYYIRIRAINENSTSEYALATMTTLLENINLNPPQLLSPVNIKSTSCLVNWIKRSYASNYLLELSTDVNFNVLLLSVYLDNIDNYFINNLIPDTQYFIRLAGLSNISNSLFSNIITFTTNIELPEITINEITDITDSSVNINWNLNSVYVYYSLTVYKKNINNNLNLFDYLGNGYFNDKNVGNVSTFALNVFLNENSSYKYFITGYTLTGDSKNSNIQEFTTRSKAPLLQLSLDGEYVEWLGNLNRLEISTDSDFKFLLKSFQSRNINNLAYKFKLTNILNSNINYFIRGNFTSNITGMYSNILSTFNSKPRLLITDITDSTATLKIKKGKSDDYKIKISTVQNNELIPLSTYNLPAYIGGVDNIMLENLISNTEYAAQLQYLDNDTYTQLSLPLRFKTNIYKLISEVPINVNLTSINLIIENIDYDRFTLNFDSIYSFYIIEISQREDFLTIDSYLEINSNSFEYISNSDTTYYIKAIGVLNGESTNVFTTNVTTLSLPEYNNYLSSAPTIVNISIINDNEIILNNSVVANSLGYIIDIALDSNFTILDTYANYTYLTNTKALISGLSSINTYYIRVYAYNANSISGYSATRTVKTVV